MSKKPVSVRLESHILKELDERAKSLGKKDRSAHLRDLIIDDLTTADEAEDRLPEIAEIRQELRALRNTLATAVTALLVSQGTPVSPAEAEKWVRENL